MLIRSLQVSSTKRLQTQTASGDVLVFLWNKDPIDLFLFLEPPEKPVFPVGVCHRENRTDVESELLLIFKYAVTSSPGAADDV